jgi:hypothetical protein
MARGVFTTMATAIALALGVNVSALGGQHGHSAAPEHPAPANPHGNSPAGNTNAPAASTKTTTTTTKTTPTTGTSGAASLSPVQQKLSTHTQLANKLQARLGSGTNVVTAASGFRTLGQFVAAVNVSHNLGIPFSQLKTDIVTNHMSLGQSIQALRPATTRTTASHEAERAEDEAQAEIDVDAKTTTTKTTSTKHSSGDK